MENSKIKLTESDDAIFHTIQGEGSRIGRPCVFIRLTMCNLRCAWTNPDGTITRCDTPHTSFEPEIDIHDIDSVVNAVAKYPVEDVVMSGGEPFFQKSVVELIAKLRECNYHVTVETNGTIYRKSQATLLSISPKLSSSSSCPTEGRRQERNRINIKSLSEMVLNHKYQFKFVVNTKEDIVEIQQLANAIYQESKVDIYENIWLMPQGVSAEQFDERTPWIAEVCKRYNWKMTDRLHIRIWGARKGV